MRDRAKRRKTGGWTHSAALYGKSAWAEVQASDAGAKRAQNIKMLAVTRSSRCARIRQCTICDEKLRSEASRLSSPNT